jgi:antitoxin ParD1/3/4
MSPVRNTSLVLGAHFHDFIASQIASGRYGTQSEVVREALRLLEEREIRLAVMRMETGK